MLRTDCPTETGLVGPLPTLPPPHGRVVRELHTIGVLWRRELLRLVRNRAQAALMMLNPLLFLLVLGTGLDRMLASGASGAGSGEYLTYLFPGVLLLAVQMPALSAGASIVRDREAGFLRGMLVAPVGRATLLVGKCLGGGTAATVQGGLMLALSGVVGLPYRPLPLVVLLLELALVALTMTALGALGAVFIRRIETFQTVLSLAMMPLFFLSGALFTVRGLPGWLNALTLVNPLTYAVDALRRTVAWGVGPGLVPAGPRWGAVVPPVGLELAAMCTLGLGALLLAAHRFAHADD